MNSIVGKGRKDGMTEKEKRVKCDTGKPDMAEKNRETDMKFGREPDVDFDLEPDFEQDQNLDQSMDLDLDQSMDLEQELSDEISRALERQGDVMEEEARAMAEADPFAGGRDYPDDEPADPLAGGRDYLDEMQERSVTPQRGRSRARRSRKKGTDAGYTAVQEPEQKEKKGFSGKKAAVAAGIFGGIIVIGGAAYLGMAQRYKRTFFPRTQINGLDVSGCSVEEVKKMIASGVDGYVLTLQERDDRSEEISGKEIALHPEFDGGLEQLLAEQNPYAWLVHSFQPEEYTIDTMIVYDEAALEQQLAALQALDPALAREPVNAAISDYVFGQGYSIVPETEGTVLKEDEFREAVKTAILNLQPELSLEEASVYKEPEIKADDPRLTEQLAAMNRYASVTVTYRFGEAREVLNGDRIHQWLLPGEDGSVALDSGKIAQYVEELAIAHNTAHKAKTLKTSYGQTVQIKGGTYGWKINQAAEAEELASVIRSGQSTEREPVYSQKAASHDGNDYGDTYVELNLTAQHLFFYKDGNLIVESDFVSGNLAKGWGTPAGSYPLTYKQRNATLKGENYRTPVDYWMPFNGGIGMHDATWRSSFGGTIYKTNGSHGCINLPHNVAKKIFENISGGMPVLCYNLPGTEKNTSSSTAPPETAAPVPTQPESAPAPLPSQPESSPSAGDSQKPSQPSEPQKPSQPVSPGQPETPSAPSEKPQPPTQGSQPSEPESRPGGPASDPGTGGGTGPGSQL